jgi:hypothetical protein
MPEGCLEGATTPGEADDTAGDPEIEAVISVWRTARGGRRMPPSEAIDPFAMKAFLPRLFVIEGEKLDDLTIRLAGTLYRDLYGFEITGHRLLNLIPQEGNIDLLEGYARCLEEAQPVFHTGRMTWRGFGSELCYRRVLLPFGEAGSVQRILGFATFTDTRGQPIFR